MVSKTNQRLVSTGLADPPPQGYHLRGPKEKEAAKREHHGASHITKWVQSTEQQSLGRRRKRIVQNARAMLHLNIPPPLDKPT